MTASAAPHSVDNQFAPEAPLVVVAEDDNTFRRMLVSMLRAAGYEVLEARNGLELLDLIGRFARVPPSLRPGLVITDVRMPGLSGLRALTALKQTRRGVPFIVITAFGSRETHEAARALGAVAVFDKPFELNELRRAVAHYLPLEPAAIQPGVGRA